MIAALSAATLTACGVDEATDGAETGTVEQGISGIGMTGWVSCSSVGGCQVPIGTVQFGQRCYISGIRGDLSFGGITFIGGGQPGSTLSLVVRPGPNRTLAAAATCISGVTTSFDGTWSSSSGSATSLGSGSGRQCAISGITNSNGLQTSSENVMTWQNDGTWFLGGTVGSGHSISAQATCWDGATVAGAVGWYDFSQFDPLSYSPAHSGMGCAPTKFQGAFTNSVAQVYSYFNGNNQTWNLDVNRAGGDVTCFF
ncbi:MAG TPA: hypothetical protein VF469_30020 [Kofleriaceae bacterium]